MAVMQCADFEEAKGGVLSCQWGFASQQQVSNRNRVGRHEHLPTDPAKQRHIRANLFQGEQDWQGTLFGVGTGHYRCRNVCTKK